MVRQRYRVDRDRYRIEIPCPIFVAITQFGKFGRRAIGVTDLERRALLGDREAQEECTRQGIVLSCPFCREAKNLVVRNVCGDAFVECLRCHATSSLTSSPDTAIKDWNTRAAPPIGRCGTCKWGCKNTEHPNDQHIYCDQYDLMMLKDDYCNYYYPEEADHGQE